MNANLYQLFADVFSANRDAVALELPEGDSCTFGDLDELAGRFAAYLIDHGVKPGDRVMAQVDKSIGAVGLYLGTLRSGAAFVPLNISYTPSEVAFFLGDAEPRVFACRPGELGEFPATDDCSHVEMGTSPEAGLWRKVLATDPTTSVAAVGDEDLAAILYTSGTTGRSKGATLSHRALASNALALHRIWGFEPSDVLIHALPIFHVHGLFVALHTAFLNASKQIFLPAFDAAKVRAELPRATILMGVPTFYTRLLAEPGFGADDCRAMRLFISGSAPMTEHVHGEWTAATGHAILERYGMTEAGMITSNPLDGERVPGTVGYALPDVEVRVCTESGEPLPAGEVGQIEIRGPNLFSGYWNLPEKTAEEMRDDGFFLTGDLGSLSEDSRLQIVGRSKDLIISGGYNIYPKEIETVLDDVDGVAESAVVGVPHADMGEGVVAVLVADGERPDDERLKAALTDKLARFKHPRRVYWVEQLPRNAMGKVQKKALRETYVSAFD
ncbi:MAG: AMP-binding protein [Pseudomonadota bacterium]